jgi:hypothetical protein
MKVYNKKDIFSGWTKRSLHKHETLTTITPLCQDGIERVDFLKTPVAEFRKRYEDPAIPCIVTNAIKDWPAVKNWEPEIFCQRFHNEKV